MILNTFDNKSLIIVIECSFKPYMIIIVNFTAVEMTYFSFYVLRACMECTQSANACVTMYTYMEVSWSFNYITDFDSM